MHEEENNFWAKTKEKTAEKLTNTWDHTKQYAKNKTLGTIDAVMPSKVTLAAIFLGAAFLGPVATHGWNRLGEVLDYTSAAECQGSADVSACAYTTMYKGGKSIAHYVGLSAGFVSNQIDEYRQSSSRHTMTGSQP